MCVCVCVCVCVISKLSHANLTEIPSKGSSSFTPTGKISVDLWVTKLLNNSNKHNTPGPDYLSERVLKECFGLHLQWVAC